ncbi:hypothetical protein LIER_23347 [Lithospermum erythrorhizon]|uniref:AUGMIN subunit 8 n=1 Tax=Lithospermum erythrorhizon TaxID=34254 RepID=A0AAV3QXC5_LITER
MDVCKSEKAALHKKHSTVETSRVPLAPAERSNGTPRRFRNREVSSRYRSPGLSVPSSVRRFPSPNTTRTVTTPAVSVPKRAVSAERKRDATPSLRPSRSSSPPTPSPSTPVQDTGVEALKKSTGNKLPENLWPSTMRSLSVSFQSDTYSLPVNKREKPPPQTLSDRTLRLSTNKDLKLGDMSSKPPKLMERKRSPLKGKNSVDQFENSNPVDGNGRLVEEHRWPSRVGGKLSSTASVRSVDLSNNNNRILSVPHLGTGMPFVRRLALDSASKPSQKYVSDLLMLISSSESLQGGSRRFSLDDNAVKKPSAVKTQPLSSSGCRHPSPNKASVVSSSLSRGVSPSRMKPVSSPASRGPSPSRVRASSPSKQSNHSISVLSFIVDIRKGQKDANHIEDAHQLRLLYNRHLQWLFANARAHDVLQSQEVKAEIMFYSVWRTISEMWDFVITKRIELQQLRLALKLYSVLEEQLAYLDQWDLIDSDHTSSVSLATEDLRACTLRLPITGSARGDIESVKAAVCSTVDIMQAMASSICSQLSPVEGMNCLISELADVAAQQRAMLIECKALLASTFSLQVEEYSIRTNLIQLRQSSQLS